MEVNISVIVPTYKRPRLLLRCLQALTSQVLEKGYYEIIIVSDGPDEKTRDMIMNILSEGMPMVHFHSLPEKCGPAAARNAGWKMAKGELIAFTDDDCIPQPDWLTNAWKIYSKLDLSRVAFSGQTIVPISHPPTDYELNISRLSECEFITANCMCTKKALEQVNGFDERFTSAWREDSDLQFKFIEHDIPIFKTDSAIVVHPVRKASWGVSLREQKKSMFNALLYKKYPKLYREKIQRHPPWRYYAIVIAVLGIVTGLLINDTITITISFIIWSVCTLLFITKRLHNTSRSPSHTTEMILTSLLIPFLSVYWRIYGALKYKVFFI